MGVSGTGKTTLARALAAATDWQFIEGDDFHPLENIEKMRNNMALTDADRLPWLRRLNARLKQDRLSHVHSVVSCSALKGSYRDILSEGLEDMAFVYLYGETGLIRERIAGRTDHFMKQNLLNSQLQTLQVPQDALGIPIQLSTAEQVKLVRDKLKL